MERGLRQCVFVDLAAQDADAGILIVKVAVPAIDIDYLLSRESGHHEPSL